jgi:hypothetical protein
MVTQLDDQSAKQQTDALPPPEEPENDDTWSGWWRLLILAFILLLVICGYWLFSTSGNAIDDVAFQYLAIATILVDVCLGGRLTMRNFRRGIPIDRRTYNLSRAGWRMWWRA